MRYDEHLHWAETLPHDLLRVCGIFAPRPRFLPPGSLSRICLQDHVFTKPWMKKKRVEQADCRPFVKVFDQPLSSMKVSEANEAAAVDHA